MNFGDDEFLGGKLFRVTHHIFEFHPWPPMKTYDRQHSTSFCWVTKTQIVEVLAAHWERGMRKEGKRKGRILICCNHNPSQVMPQGDLNAKGFIFLTIHKDMIGMLSHPFVDSTDESKFHHSNLIRVGFFLEKKSCGWVFSWIFLAEFHSKKLLLD